MLVIFILLLWLGWLGVRAWLRRNDPEGLALLIGEEEARALHPAGHLRPEVLQRTAAMTPAAAAPPAVGALTPRTQAGYGQIPAYNRRFGDRRRFAERRSAPRNQGDRRAGYDRRSA